MNRRVMYSVVVLFGLAVTFVYSFFPSVSHGPSISKPVELPNEATSTSVLRDPSHVASVSGEFVLVTRVIDGDTIELIDGRKVRYIGIDTPEMGDARKTIACYAKEAMEENRRLVDGKTIRLEKDISELDRYGRLLRYVSIGDVFVNDHLVRQGYANVATFPPDVAHQEQFLEAEREAREQNRGLWTRNYCFLNGHVSEK